MFNFFLLLRCVIDKNQDPGLSSPVRNNDQDWLRNFIIIFGASFGFADVTAQQEHTVVRGISPHLHCCCSMKSPPPPPGSWAEIRTKDYSIFATCLSVPDRWWCQLRFLSGPLPPKQHSRGSERSEHGSLLNSKQIASFNSGQSQRWAGYRKIVPIEKAWWKKHKRSWNF